MTYKFGENLVEHIADATNKIQVFGLPRSGTNFIEWSLLNNFDNVVYNNYNVRYSVSGEIRDYYKKIGVNGRILTKHCMPDQSLSYKRIIVYKEYIPWILSMEKYRPDMFNSRQYRNAYEVFAEYTNNLPHENTLIFEHSTVVNNYNSAMKEIAKEFNIVLKEYIEQPIYRLDKGGAKSKQTGRKFFL